MWKIVYLSDALLIKVSYLCFITKLKPDYKGNNVGFHVDK